MNKEHNGDGPPRISESGILWIEEKLTHSVAFTATTYDWLRQTDTMTEEVDFSLGTSLSYAINVLALLCGATFERQDVDLVRLEGKRGFDQLLVKYRDPDLFKANRRYYHLTPFAAEARRFLDGDRSPNRTLMHELLEGMRFDAPVIERLKQLTEKVTMGQLEWIEYVTQAREVLGDLSGEDPFS